MTADGSGCAPVPPGCAPEGGGAAAPPPPTPRKNGTAYMRQYRARYGGSTPGDKANARAVNAAANWVRHNHPDIYRALLAKARQDLGLPIDVGPRGHFNKPINHGTNGGYRAHIYRGEHPCDACRDARRKYQRDRYHNKKEIQ